MRLKFYKNLFQAHPIQSLTTPSIFQYNLKDIFQIVLSENIKKIIFFDSVK